MSDLYYKFIKNENHLLRNPNDRNNRIHDLVRIPHKVESTLTGDT